MAGRTDNRQDDDPLQLGFTDPHQRQDVNALEALSAVNQATKGLVSGEIFEEVFQESAVAARVDQGLYFEHHGGNLSAAIAAKLIGRVFAEGLPSKARKALLKLKLNKKGGLANDGLRAALGLPIRVEGDEDSDTEADDLSASLALLAEDEGLSEDKIAAEHAAIIAEAEAELAEAKKAFQRAEAVYRAALESGDPKVVAKTFRELSRTQQAQSAAWSALAEARSTGKDLSEDPDGLHSLITGSLALTKAPDPYRPDLSSVLSRILSKKEAVKTKKEKLMAAARGLLASLNLKKNLYDAILSKVGRKGMVIDKLKDVPSQDILYEQFAHGIYDRSEGFTEGVGSWATPCSPRSGTGSRASAARPTGSRQTSTRRCWSGTTRRIWCRSSSSRAPTTSKTSWMT